MSKENKLEVIVGKNADGEDKLINLTALRHLLINGLPQTGKTDVVKNVIHTAMQKSPKENIFMIVDTTGLKYFGYEHNDFLPLSVVGSEDAYGVTHLAKEIMEQRYDLFAKNRITSIEEYNKRSSEKLPNVFLVIDSYTDLINYAYALERDVIKILTHGVLVGVYLILVSNSMITENMFLQMPPLFNTRIATKHNQKHQFSRTLGIHRKGKYNLEDDECAMYLGDKEAFVVLDDGVLDKVSLSKNEDSGDFLEKVSKKYPLSVHSKIDNIELDTYKEYFVDKGESEWVDDKKLHIRPAKKRKGLF